MKQNAFAWLPKWLMWLAIAGIGVSHLLAVLVVGYVLWEQATPAKPLPASQVAEALPSPAPDPLTQDWIEEEAATLLAQAQKDVQSPGSPCYGRSPACPLWHYRQDAEVRQRALKLIGTGATSQP